MRYIKNMFAFALLFIFSSTLVLAPASFAAQTGKISLDQEDLLEQKIKKVLQKHPEIVLSVLEKNSELVFEVVQQGSLAKKRKAIVSQWYEDTKTPKLFNMDKGFRFGKHDAPVTIVAFSDFTCSFCQIGEQTIAELMQKEAGQIQYLFKPLPRTNHPVAEKVARIAVAAYLTDKEKGNKLFHQTFLQSAGIASEGESVVKKIASEVGFDLKKLENLANSKQVTDYLNEIRREADSYGVQGTPNYFINDIVLRGALPIDFFEEAIQIAKAKKK